MALSIFAACAAASLVALSLPWFLNRLGIDPAFGSGPLATVIQDLRFDNWKVVFMEQRCAGTMAVWSEPFVPLRISIVLLLQSGCATVQRTQEANGASIVVKKLVKTTKSWDSQLLLAYPLGQPEITIRRIGITGQLTVVTADGKTLHLKAGEPIVEVVNTPHYGINRGDVPAEIVVFYAGTVDTPLPAVK